MILVKSMLDSNLRLFQRKQLLHYEQLCLDAWRESLESETRRILDAQLAAGHIVQPQAGGAKVCFYYPADSENGDIHHSDFRSMF